MTSDMAMFINHGDLGQFDLEEKVFEIYIPEKANVYNGTLKIVSGNNVLFSKNIDYTEMDFDDYGRYYCYYVEYKDLNIRKLKNEDIINATFTYGDGNSSISESCFYLKMHYDEGNYVSFAQILFKNGNMMDDDDVLVIIGVPSGVDDVFSLHIDRWGEIQKIVLNLSELTPDEKGRYSFNISSLKLDKFMNNINDADIEVRVQFYRNGQKADDVWGNFFVYKSPSLISGEFNKNEGAFPVIMFLSLPKGVFDDTFKVLISKNGASNTSRSFKLSKMNSYYIEEYEFYGILSSDLGISGKGKYDVSVVFTKDGKKTTYSTTFSIVDYVIDAPSFLDEDALDDVNSYVFFINLPKNTAGRAIVYANGTEIFNESLSNIPHDGEGAAEGFYIYLNALQINETGRYNLKLEVHLDKSSLVRTAESTVDVEVGENSVEFVDIIYGTNVFFKANISSPIPVNSKFVLYLNNAKAATIDVGNGFGLFDLDKSFKDSYGVIKVGRYDAKLTLVNGDNETVFGNGTFNVLDSNGNINVSVPANILTVDIPFVTFEAALPKNSLSDYRIRIYIDPYVEDFGFNGEPYVELNCYDLEEFWYGFNNKIVMNTLSAGSHRVFVEYLSEYDYVKDINSDFFAKSFTINVKKSSSKMSIATLKTTTYNSGKYLIATIKDAYGRAAKGVTVTVKVSNGVTKKIKSNNKGQIKFLVSSLAPSSKAYTVKFIFNGNSKFYKASTVSTKVKITKASPKLKPTATKYKASQKTKKYTVTVTTNKNPLKNVKVTLKVNGKTFSAKTNSKGIATFKVTKLNKKGTYKAKATLKGNNKFKSATKSFKIVVK